MITLSLNFIKGFEPFEYFLPSIGVCSGVLILVDHAYCIAGSRFHDRDSKPKAFGSAEPES